MQGTRREPWFSWGQGLYELVVCVSRSWTWGACFIYLKMYHTIFPFLENGKKPLFILTSGTMWHMMQSCLVNTGWQACGISSQRQVTTFSKNCMPGTVLDLDVRTVSLKPHRPLRRSVLLDQCRYHMSTGQKGEESCSRSSQPRCG